MTPNEYKQAQQTLGFGYGRLHDWLELLGISESSHKKYTTGHLPVSPTVAKLIAALLKIQTLEHQLSEVAHAETK